MQVELMYEPAYTLGRVLLQGGEKVRVEASSMVGMSGGVTLETTATGGIYEIPQAIAAGGRKLFFQKRVHRTCSGRERARRALSTRRSENFRHYRTDADPVWVLCRLGVEPRY